MINWQLTPELQTRYNEVVATIRRLQSELGITPMTLEERRDAYLARQAELKRIEQITGKRRPLPKWKV